MMSLGEGFILIIIGILLGAVIGANAVLVANEIDEYNDKQDLHLKSVRLCKQLDSGVFPYTGKQVMCENGVIIDLE